MRPILAKIDLGATAALEPAETAADASGTAGGAGASAEAENEETAASAGRSRTPVAPSAEDASGPARVQLDCSLFTQWDPCHNFCYRGPILIPRPVLEFPAQTTRVMLLDFFVNP